MNANPSAIEILEWLAHKADFTEASIAFGAGGWKEHVAPALRVVLDQITAYQASIAALRQRVEELERDRAAVDEVLVEVRKQGSLREIDCANETLRAEAAEAKLARLHGLVLRYGSSELQAEARAMLDSEREK